VALLGFLAEARARGMRRMDVLAPRSTLFTPRRFALLALLTCLASAWLLSAPAHACSCQWLEHRAAVAAHAVAARAKVTSIVTRHGQHIVTLEVLERWKGVAADVRTLTVHRAVREGMCPIPRFRVGATYALYAERERDHLRVGSCNPTRPG
jgi:hypothetical protein